MTPEFGDTKPGQVVYTTFTRKNLEKIQYDDVVARSFDNMENLVIDGIIVRHPDLRE